MSQFVTKMTKEEMDKESKKATLEGMKNLISRFNDFEEPSSDSDSEYNSKLESRIHYMKLDLGNLTLELMETKEKLEKATQRLEAFTQIDNNLALLSNLGFYLKGLDSMTLEQVKGKLAMFKEEQEEHIQNCLKNSSHLEFSAMKESVRVSLLYKRKQNRKIEDGLTNAINKKWLLNSIKLLITILCIIFILFHCLVYLLKN